MKIIKNESQYACGVNIEDVDLSKPLEQSVIQKIREVFLENHVIVFPNQILNVSQLEQFSQYFGPFGDDPFIQSIDESENVIAVQRRADETASIFADVWHTDWSFQLTPPAGTCLYGVTIPPVGGNTDFINQKLAFEQMPVELRKKIEGKKGVHSAILGYSPEGLYGEADADSDRSMKIISSDQAYDQQTHPLIRVHPETGLPSLYGCLGYIIGIEDMEQDAAVVLLQELYDWQTREVFQYKHQWQPNMLVMWDNRSVLHKANGGYDGYDRLLYRTTLADTSS